MSHDRTATRKWRVTRCDIHTHPHATCPWRAQSPVWSMAHSFAFDSHGKAVAWALQQSRAEADLWAAGQS